MNDLHFLFEGGAHGLQCRVVLPNGSSTQSRPFHLPAEIEKEMHWYFAEYFDIPSIPNHLRAKRVEQQMRMWGVTAYESLVNDGVGQTIRARTSNTRAGTWTVVSSDPAILRLPWELLHDGNKYLFEQGIRVRRTFTLVDRRPRPSAKRTKLRLLLVLPCPRGLPFLDSSALLEALYDVGAMNGAYVQIDICRPPTFSQLKKTLDEAADKQEPYDVVHFRGHGSFSAQTQNSGLCFEMDESCRNLAEKDPITPETFVAIFQKYAPRLIVLDACHTGRVGKALSRQTYPMQLLLAGIDHVIAMGQVVHVEATRLFFEAFYKSLFGGESIGNAMHLGRVAMGHRVERWLERVPGGAAITLQDWCVPVLYQRSFDEQLLATPKLSIPSKRVRKVLHGRGRDIIKMERTFRLERCIVLHAMGGMGKTRLAQHVAEFWTSTGLFPDGTCIVSFEFGLTAETMMRELASSLKLTEYDRWSESEQRQRLIEAFQSKRLLMIWDNFESTLPQFQENGLPNLYSMEEIKKIRELYHELTADPNGAGRLLITSRAYDVHLGQVARLELQGLDLHSALSLLFDRRKQPAKNYPRASLERLVTALGGHPLSIELIAPHLEDVGPNRIVHQLKALIERFEGNDEQPRNRSLRASLQFSMRRLTDSARRALHSLAWFRPGVHERVFMGFLGISQEQWKPIKDELEGVAIINVEIQYNGLSYIQLHPTLPYLLDRSDATRRWNKRFISAYLAWRDEFVKRRKGSRRNEAIQMMRLESENMQKAILCCIEMKRFAEATVLADSLLDYLEQDRRLHARDRIVKWLFDRTRHEPCEEYSVLRHIDYTVLLLEHGKTQKALDELRRLLRDLEQVAADADFRTARVRTELGYLYGEAGHNERATKYLTQAIAEWEALARGPTRNGVDKSLYRDNLASAHNYLAEVLIRQGRFSEAAAHLEESRSSIWLDTTKRLEWRLRKGCVLAAQGKHKAAQRCYEFALNDARRRDDRDGELNALVELAELYIKNGKLEEAHAHLQSAHQILEAFPDRRSGIRIHLNFGNLFMHQRRFEDAERWLESALRWSGNDERAQAAIMLSQAHVWELHANDMLERGGGTETDAYAKSIALFVQCLHIAQSLKNEQDTQECAQALHRIHQKTHGTGDLESDAAHFRTWMVSHLNQ